MESLLDETASKLIVDRINHLSSESKPLWGKMNAAQMLEHLQKPLAVAIGDLNLKRGLIGFLFGKIAKRSMLKGPFTKNLPTDPSFLIKNTPDFTEAKTGTISMIEKLVTGGPTSLTTQPHPFFGKMAIEEWDKLLWKHFDHHLRQFGV